MTQDAVYEKLARALEELPDGFPRTPSNVEIRILKKIFPEESARIACRIRAEAEPVAEVAKRCGLPYEEVLEHLRGLAAYGLVRLDESGDPPLIALAALISGMAEDSYDGQIQMMDHELSHLVESYMAAGGAKGMYQLQPPIYRVVPAQGTVATGELLEYDDIPAMLDQAKTFSSTDCVCRSQQDLAHHRTCDFPLNICLSMHGPEHPAADGGIRREAFEALVAEAEKVGLVHTVNNNREGLRYLCNCCSCCCNVMRGLTEWEAPGALAAANYRPQVDATTCVGCGTCVERCPVGAIALPGSVPMVDRDRCIGCGVCAAGCAAGAIVLRRNPEEELIHPPRTEADLAARRQANKKLVK